MNTMKRILSSLYVYTLLAIITLASCSNDEPNPLAPSTGNPDISVSEFVFDKDGGTANFTVNGGTAFVRSEAEWLSVSRVSGDKHESSFSVVCEANKGEARTGQILVNLEGAFTRIEVSQAGVVTKPDVEYSFRTAKAVAKDMYPGWNLGNTMEATGDGLAAETAWQTTRTTREIIAYVKAQGFKSVRIPCSWDIHSANGKIDAEWLGRVKDIVDYCIDEGLYVMLNDHWDGGWIEILGFSKSADRYEAVDEETVIEKTARLKDIWTQIANAFQNYDEHLLFAGLNEPFQEYNLFHDKHQQLTPVLMRYNQAFVEAVRATGGNNAKRVLIVQGPSTNIDSTVKYFSMPTDEAQNALMCEVHYYSPWNFCGGTGDYYWGKAQGDSDTEEAMEREFKQMYDKFVVKDIPVIIGEYSAKWRDLSSKPGEDQAKHDASIKAWFKAVNLYCGNFGMIPFVWDINVADRNGADGVMTIINRKNLSVFNTAALDGIKEGVTESKWPY